MEDATAPWKFCKASQCVALGVQVQVQDLQVTVGEWPCGSWDITVASRALLITDTRMLDDAPFLYIVQIGEVEGMLTSTAPKLISRVTSSSRTASSILGETASTGLSGTASRWTAVSPGHPVCKHCPVLPSSRICCPSACERQNVAP